ncbi:redoxin domain-containing protein [Fredinandcohnia sp. QZ13]|uniref:peroxiredoxin family protein n=1 Tax=Fredinandcohnia sp. QZ13 TaxID=3073144 RepID=UPI00285335EC|nr:redoxin domain-containing protein [Fredinandcohnia sp. QZ13]MDR4889507.1 redoxin domain-containing protein [Fredinandcohnia sp. QZ13]
MHFIQIGSLAIMTKWIILGIGIITGLLVARFWLAKTQTKEITKAILNLLTNGIFIGFLSWKGSLILLEPKLVIKSPMSLLYFTGGTKGFVIAFVITLLYLLYHLKKGTVHSILLIRSILITSFTTLMTYDLLALFWLQEQVVLHFIKSMGAFFLVLLTFYYRGPQKKEVFHLFKKAALIVGLTGLIVWTINSNISFATPKEEVETVENKVGISEGQLAPDFTLKTINGEELTLSAFRGKKVILNFWASWCPPCKAEMPHMQEFYVENKDSNIVLLSVNLTTAEKKSSDVAKFVDEYELTFPVMLDEKGDIGQTYQAYAIPTSYLIDSKGVVRKKVVGPMDKEMMNGLFNSIK